MTETQRMYEAVDLYELPPYAADLYRIKPPDTALEMQCWQYLTYFGSLAVLCSECQAKKARGEALPERCTNIVAIDLGIKY